MERKVRELFNTDILLEAARLFNARADSAVLLSDMENFVYACDGAKDPIVLRITHSSHRNIQALQGELDWMAYLSKGGVPLPEPLRSMDGNLVEQVGGDNGQFLATAFSKIPGQTILDAEECTPEIYQQWGGVLGRMHALTKDYLPPHPSLRRPAWFENDILANAKNYIPGQTVVIDKLKNLMDDLQTLPQDRDSFGLIHSDFTDVNFFVHDHHITAFDFDDSEYHWLIYDIAVILFDIPWLPQLDLNEADFGKYFWQSFYKGYSKENVLDGNWLERLPQFMKLRQIFLYIVYHKKWDLDNLTARQQQVLSEYKDKIENDIPCLSFIDRKQI
jgi:Ser/Thr protein kinase RdoA (MazF antagonist)